MHNYTIRLAWQTLAALVLFAPYSLSQTSEAQEIQIVLDPDASLLTINSLPFTSGITVEDILNEFGEPDSIQSYREGERSYVYERFGLVVGTIADEIKVLGITFTDDGDKHFARTPFTGSLRIGGTEVTALTQPDTFQEMKNPAFVCQTIMCAGASNGENTLKIMAGFTGGEKNKLTQIAFLIDG